MSLAFALLAGCSSSGGSSASGSGGATGSASGGTPIKIMTIGEFSGSSVLNYPQLGTAIQAYFSDLNAKGGVNGHHIDLEVCTDKGNPNTAATCARQAVQDQVVAVIQGFSIEAANIIPILQDAHISYIASVLATPQDASSSYSFPVDGGTITTSAAIGQGLGAAGCKNGAYITFQAPSADQIQKYVDLGMKSKGSNGLTTTYNVGTGLPDYTATVASAIAKHSDCLMIDVPAADAAKIVNSVAESSDPNLTIGAFTPSFPASVLNGLPARETSHIILGTTQLLPGSTDPAVVSMTAAIDKYQPGTAILPYTPAVWAASEILTAGLKGVTGGYTAASVYAAMGKLRDVNTGLMGPYTTADGAKSIAGFTRLFNLFAMTAKVDNGKTVPTSGFVNMSSVIAG
jgi:ABC-type branched-subunit amino acid transport system substrate-binding protein